MGKRILPWLRLLWPAISLLIFLAGTDVAWSAASNSTITYQARILNTNGLPVTGNVNFVFSIVDPNNNCALWTESQNNVSVVNGVVSVIIGAGVNTAPGGLASFGAVFQNAGGPFGGLSSPAGLAGCTGSYTPAVGDTRDIFVSFNDGTGAQYTSPMTINSVPFAQSVSNLIGYPLGLTVPTAGQGLVFNGAQWVPAPLGGTGTVTDVGLADSGGGIFNVTGGPITTSGSFSLGLSAQPQALVLASPVVGAGVPVFRALAFTDIPGLPASQITQGTLAVNRGGTGVNGSTAGNGQLLIGNGSGFALNALTAGSNITIVNSAGGIQINSTASGSGSVTDVGLTMPSIFTVNPGSVTTAGTFGVTLNNANQNAFFAGPSVGGAGTPSFRSIAVADIPNLPASQITSGTFATAQLGNLPAANVQGGTLATSVLGQIPASSVVGGSSGSVTDVYSGTGLNVSPNPITGVGTISLANTAVTPNTYGSVGSYIPYFTVNAQGQLTNAGSTAISMSFTNLTGTISTAQLGNIPSNVLSGTISNAVLGQVPAGNVQGGTLATSVLGTIPESSLPASGVVANTYGDVGNYMPYFTVNSQGLLTAAGSTAIIGAGNVSLTTSNGTLTITGTGGGGGTVFDVGLSMPSIFSVTGGPVTNIGTFGVTLNNASANAVFAAPSGVAGTPSFRTLLAADIPNLAASQITSGTFATAQLGNLPAVNVQGGTLATSVLGNIPSGLLSGTISTADLGSVPAADVQGGTLATSVLGTIPASSISGIPTGGTFAAASGSAALPTHTFTASTNTGMWLPGTGTLAFSTSGTEAMRISSTGNLGIGTTSPGSMLSVEGNAAIGTYGTLAAPANGLIVSGNVGIGTATPWDQFVLLNSANAGSSLSIATPGTQNAQQAYYSLMSKSNNAVLGSAGTKGWQVLARGDAWSTASQQNDFGFSYFNGASWNNPMWISSSSGGVAIGTYASYNVAPNNGLIVSGTVGISTPTPAHMLDVNGDINGTQLCIAGTCKASWPSGVASIYQGTGLSANPNPIIGIGTISLATTGVTANTYGDVGNYMPYFTVNSQGQLTAAGSTAIIGAGNVSLSTSNGTLTITGTGGGGGTVFDVGLSMPSIFGVSGGPITNIGTFSVTLNNASQNAVFAGPASSGAGTPSFRNLAAADIPNLAASQITSGTFATAQLGNLPAVNVQGGTLATSVLGTIPASSLSGALTNGGTFAAANGSAALPSFTFTSNTNTGMWLPGTGTLGFSTGGAEAMRIASGGSVGIGTTTPTYTLDVVGNSRTTNSVNGGIGIYGVTTGTTGASYGVRGDSADGSGAGVYGVNTGLNGSGVYGLANNGNTAGVLGVTSSTTAGANGGLFTAYGTIGQTVAMWAETHSTTAGAKAVFGHGWSTSGATYGVYGDNNSPSGFGGYFTGNGSGGVALATGGGSVGINTNAPAHMLDVNGDINGTKLCISGTCQTSWSLSGLTGTISMAQLGTIPIADIATSGGTLASSVIGTVPVGDIATSGGTLATSVLGTIPASSLSGIPATGGTFAAASGSAALPSFTFTASTNTGMWLPGTGTLAFSTGGSERMRIDSSGNVGIGTTTPASALDINVGNINATTFGTNIFATANGTTGTAETLHVATNVLPASAPTSSYTGGGIVGASWAAGNANINTGAQGVGAFASYGGTATLGSATGISSAALNQSTGTIALAVGGQFYTQNQSTGGITTSYGVEISNPTGGTVINNYGLYIGSQTAGTSNNYAIYSQGGTNYFGGTVGIGTTNPQNPLHVHSGTTSVAEIESSGSYASLLMQSQNSTPWQGNFVTAQRTRAGFTAVANGDTLFEFNLMGLDGSAFQSSSQIISLVDGPVSSGIVPGEIQFETADTSGAMNPRMSIMSNGSIGIGTTAPAHMLDVAGDINGTKLCIAGTCQTSWSVSGLTGTISMAQLGTVPIANIATSGGTLATSVLGVIPGTSVSGVLTNGGTFAAASGTAALPTHTFTASTNTGMWLPGTGTLGFSTNGTEAMRINNIGYVGIGTTSPQGILDVEGGTAAASTNGTPINIVAQNSGSGNQNGGTINMQAGNGAGTGNGGNITMYTGTTATGAPGYFQFVTQSNSSNGSTFDFVNNSGGAASANTSVGIQLVAGRGAPNASGALQAGDTIGAIQFDGYYNTIWGNGVGAEIVSTAQGNFTSSSTPADLEFKTTLSGTIAASTRMLITQGGSVGIGTGAPAHWLDVNGDINGTKLCIAGTCQTSWGISGLTGTISMAQLGTVPVANIATSGGTLASSVIGTVPVADIATSGGTLATSVLGVIPGTSVSGVLTNGGTFAAASGSAALPTHTFTASTNTGMWLATAGSLAFSTNGTEAMRINNLGYVGIGTTTPTTKFDVNVVNGGSGSTASFFNDTDNATAAGTISNLVPQQGANAPSTSAATYVDVNAYVATYNNVNYTGAFYGVQEQFAHTGTGTVANGFGGEYTIQNESSGVISNGVAGEFGVQNLSTGSVTTAVGAYINPVQGGTAYGVEITGVAGTSHTYDLYANDAAAINYFAGTVGIGTTTPIASMHIAAQGTPANPLLILQNTNATGEIGWDMLNNVGTFVAEIGVAESAGQVLSTSVANDLAFKSITGNVLFGTSTGGGNERMRIQANGSVGINTTTPAHILDVNGDINGTQLCIAGTCKASWALSGLTGTISMAEMGTVPIANIATSGGTLASSVVGNIPLSGIAGALTAGGTFAAAKGSAALPTFTFAANTNTGMWLPGTGTLAFSTNGTEAMRINNLGYVGIGTTAPPMPFYVQAGNINSTTYGSQILATATFLNAFETTLYVGATVAPTTAPGSYVSGIGLTAAGYAAGTTVNANTDATGINTYGMNDSNNVLGQAIGVEAAIINNDQGIITNAIAGGFYTTNTSTGTIANSYGIQISNPSGTGVVQNSYGLYVQSQTAGTSSNYAIYSQGGTNYFGGSVGIGTTTPASPLVVNAGNIDASNYGQQILGTANGTTGTGTGLYISVSGLPTSAPTSNNKALGLDVATWVSGNSNSNSDSSGINSYAGFGGTATLGQAVGISAAAMNQSTGVITNAYGGSFYSENQTTGVITNAYGATFSNSNNSTGTISNAYSAYVQNPTNSGTITNNYGLYVQNQTAGATNYAIYSQGGTNYFGGTVGIGTTTPQTKLDVAGGVSIHGTTFTAAGCTNSTLVGGSTVGSFKVGQTTSCTITITMGNAQTATNGWSCWINDLTSVPTVAFRQSATTTTSASFTGTATTAADVFTFGCVGY